MKLAWCTALVLFCACSRGSYAEPDDETTSGGAQGTAGSAGMQQLPQDTEFQLVPEFEGPCERKLVVDVNLGHSPEAFVRAAQCQVAGSEPDAATVSELSEQLRTLNHVRRIDVVRTLCERAGKTCSFHYSDPWQQQVQLTTACARKGTRDLGAVLMYWSECPTGVNCGMNWANTHAPGMSLESALLAFGDEPQGFYNPGNVGWWRRELLDASWSGLQFLALNTFGPDLAELQHLGEALGDLGGGMQVALFDDTWGWGKGDAPWGKLPSFNDSEAAAQLIYQKWQQFYRAVPSEHWYRHQGRPLVVFYNAGTLEPENKSAATLGRLKELFKAEFGEDVFLAVDRAFFQDPATPGVADSQFRWNTFSNNELSRSDMNGVTYDHFMVKWDSLGRDVRDNPSPASPTDQLIKGPELLEQYLADSAGSDLAVIATWNDLGEGTGVSRNYDYFHRGEWLPPNAFMGRIRASQCQ